MPPGKADQLFGRFVTLIRWPVMSGLVIAVFLQAYAAFSPILKPDVIGAPDLIPPLNTAVLALLWWRVSQLEKFRERRERRDDEDRNADRRKKGE